MTCDFILNTTTEWDVVSRHPQPVSFLSEVRTNLTYIPAAISVVTCYEWIIFVLVKIKACFRAWLAASPQVKSCPSPRPLINALTAIDEAHNEGSRHPECDAVWCGTDLTTYQRNIPPPTSVYLTQFWSDIPTVSLGTERARSYEMFVTLPDCTLTHSMKQ
jgi:hypothetical protein